MDKETAVKKRYEEAARAKEETLCCPTSYNPEYLRIIPEEILQKDYGCGDPSQYVQEGETVLDLGSGAGKLCYIIAQVVGPSGKVIGVDMNDEMLRLARKYQKIIGDKLGYHNVEFKKGKIQNLKLDLEKLDEYLSKNPVTSSEDFTSLNAFIEKLEKTAPLIPDNSIDVVVSNCVLNLVKPEDKSKLFKEIQRVLKKGGRAVISDIVSDEDVPQDMQDDPELWSGCISGAFREDLFINAFEDSGFYGIKILKYDEKPWRVVNGIEFRSITVSAFKGKEGPCMDYGHAVIYRGPYKEIKDDDGHIFERGKRIAVCEKTFRILKNPPYHEDFILIEPHRIPEPLPFPCSGGIIYRLPAETKGGVITSHQGSSQCCPGGACDTIEGFDERLKRLNKTLIKNRINTIQVNVGSLCNQSCIHCHVEASPDSKSIMSWDTMERIINLIRKNSGMSMDITGGAPELHPEIERFISSASEYAESIILRSNLTALLKRLDLIRVMKERRVTLVCSLPDIDSKKTDHQRGKGVFKDSLRALRILNDNGYGYELQLHLVHNPVEPVLPELQEIIEDRYRNYLREEHGIVFNKLYTLNNMPVGRFKKILKNKGAYNEYMKTLYSNFNIQTIDNLMCKHIINIAWDGSLYDCDFNNALNLRINLSIEDIDTMDPLENSVIKTGEHCYGCTAMKGSGCYGSIVR